MKKHVLLVYAHGVYPMRATTWQLLRAFQDYSKDHIYPLNLLHRRVPWYVNSMEFDLILFHTLFLTAHWGGPQHFHKMMRRAEPLRHLKAVKAMLPQDEFMRSDLYCEFINEFGIDWVFSVAPESEWRKIYHSVDFDRVKFCQVLTGYFDERKLAQIVAAGQPLDNRPIDIGYRTAGKPNFVWGRHGFLKQQIADVFTERAPVRGLQLDVSTRDEDIILGDEWYRFLGKCKYTLGVESGTSMIDPDGTIQQRVDTYLAAHPTATFEEVETTCFPGIDGSTHLYTISPRHIEACATRTCQVLTEGEYNGILDPWKHYIPLKKDFSNVEQVLDILAQDNARKEIVETAYVDVVASGRFTYSEFVRFVVEQALASSARLPKPAWLDCWRRVIHILLTAEDSAEWLLIKRLLAPYFRPLRSRLKQFLAGWR